MKSLWKPHSSSRDLENWVPCGELGVTVLSLLTFQHTLAALVSCTGQQFLRKLCSLAGNSGNLSCVLCNSRIKGSIRVGSSIEKYQTLCKYSNAIIFCRQIMFFIPFYFCFKHFYIINKLWVVLEENDKM